MNKKSSVEFVTVSPIASWGPFSSMALTRQFSSFLAVGLAQYALDLAAFAVLFLLSGQAAPSNIFSRALGAGLGYYLNGRFTFGLGHGLFETVRIVRFTLTWGVMTIASTLLLAAAVDAVNEQGFGRVGALLSKALIEAFLVTVSFIIQKLWVFSRR